MGTTLCIWRCFNNSIPTLFDYEQYLLPYQNSNPPNYKLTDFEEIYGDFDVWDSSNLKSLYNEIVVDAKPLNTADSHINQRENILSEAMNVVYGRKFSVSDRNNEMKRVGRYKSCALELDEIQKYFLFLVGSS
ncbi:protein RKD3-like [Forsythia ovata]|uniref:Protein RKD3-like n=1 Tax=Forsythia ovata TaxID=205694 RepID=A0ABD1SQI8_9LAMI